MKIHYLSDTWPWLGAHTGYHRLPNYVKSSGVKVNVTDTRFGFVDRCAGKIYCYLNGWHDRRDSVYAASEWRYSRKIKNSGIHHILYYDVHYRLFERWNKAPESIIVTIHHPPGRDFPEGMRENLKRLSSAIVLTTKDIGFYEKIIGKGRVRFIPHGVDTEFFRPITTSNLAPRTSNLLFTGQNGRNTKMLERVIKRLFDKYENICLDLLVPKNRRETPGLRQLAGHPRVFWHENLSDEDLRALYQNSYLLLQPMEDCAANNAIVESLACGLPVVTTDVGGVRDYGGGTVYPVVANNDDEAMGELVEKYMADTKWREEIGSKCRKFAEKGLSWQIVATRHLEVYREIFS